MFTKEARASALQQRARIKRAALSAVGGTAAWKALPPADRKKKYQEAKVQLEKAASEKAAAREAKKA